MSIVSDKFNSGLKLSAILVAAALATGCISAKSKPTEEATAAAPAPAPAAPAAAPATDTEPASTALTSWTVVEGNNLWGISCKEEVYNVPEQWPLIYKANLDQIKDADLIYPGQVLTIPRDSSQADIDGAIKHAKTRGAWAVGPVEASDVAYIKSSS
jgi:nucleoid-associated protein YgaU